MSAGTLTSGPVVSVTVTERAPDAWLPRTSSAEQVTVCSPTTNAEPDDGLHDTVTGPSTRSVAVAVKDTTFPVGPSASTMTSAGRCRVGALVSTMVTVNEALPVLPWSSVAVHVTVVSPSGRVEPDGVVQETGRAPSTRSRAEAS